MRPCTNKSGCHGCSNEYGRREASDVLFPQKRNIKCTSSPSSIQWKRTDVFLMENYLKTKQGSWTTEETCLLEAVLSFLNSTSIELFDEHITNMYNFVCSFAFTCTANCKSERQITGKLNYIKNRQNALQKMLYGIAALDSPT